MVEKKVLDTNFTNYHEFEGQGIEIAGKGGAPYPR